MSHRSFTDWLIYRNIDTFILSTKRRIIDGKFTNNCRPRFNGRYVWSIKLTWFTEHDEFKMLFVSFISRSFIEDISSRGRMPQIKTLIALFPCLKQLAILIRPFAISSGESVEVLELLHIFVQAYEQVYATNLHIKWKHRDLYSKIIPITGGFHQMRVFQTVPSNATTAWIYKIGLLIPEQLLSEQLVKRLKVDIIIVQCNYIKKDLILLSRGESKILQINLNLYIPTFLAISQNSGKDLPVKLWKTSQIWKNTKS